MGSVPTWLAFASALTAVYFTWRALVRERRRDTARELDDRKAQADRFAGWLGQQDGADQDAPYFLFLRNSSELPFYDLRVKYWDTIDDKLIAGFTTALVIPSSKAQSKAITSEQTQNWIANSARRGRIDDKRPGYGLIMEFRDAAGVCWRRNVGGSLVEFQPSVTA